MAGETIMTVVGNLTADPELRFTPNGDAVANFTVASTPRQFDKQTQEWRDGDALFMRCNIWRQAAENVCETLTRGMRVLVVGRVRQRSFETREGEKRTVVELEVDEVGPSLRYGTAVFTKVATGGYGGAGEPRQESRQERPAQRQQRPAPERQRPAQGRRPQPQDDNPWQPSLDDDEPPF